MMSRYTNIHRGLHTYIPASDTHIHTYIPDTYIHRHIAMAVKQQKGGVSRQGRILLQRNSAASFATRRVKATVAHLNCEDPIETDTAK